MGRQYQRSGSKRESQCKERYMVPINVSELCDLLFTRAQI